MIPSCARSEGELHHLQHCHGDQCLQQRRDQLLECLQLHKPMWKQAHEQSSVVLRVKMRTTEIGSTTKGSVGAARLFLVLRFFLEGAALEAFVFFLFLASASAALAFFSSEAVDMTFGFEPVMLLGKTMRGSSCLEGACRTVDSFFFFAAILGSMPGWPSDLRFSASL